MMDTRQSSLERLVVDYCRSRKDIQIHRAAKGSYGLRLNSAEAKSQFGGKDELILTFSVDDAFRHPEWELINATHPILDTIRNVLTSEDDDPRISEAFFPPFPLSPDGDARPPYVEIIGPVTRFDFTTDYRPHFILAYKVVFESDERQDYVLQVCFDARTGERCDQAITHLARLPIVDGRPPSIPDRGNLADLAEVLKLGRTTIEARVRPEIASLTSQYADQLTKEKDRLKQYYESELQQISKRDEAGRQKLGENLKKEVEDFERKYTCRARASLVSVLLLWTPVLHYHVHAVSKKSNFIVDGFAYDACADKIFSDRCPKCENELRFCLCCSGKHAACGESSCTPMATCGVCGDTYCPVHGNDCSHCDQPTCSQDLEACSYGKHRKTVKFCPQCTHTSFEGKIICAECSEDCDLCLRTFPGTMVFSCSVGGERFCSGHERAPDGDLCSECHKPVCNLHGRETKEGVWACNQHTHAATCCGDVFGMSRLITCIEDESELLCPAHRLSCAVCSGAICQHHVVQSWQGEFLCGKDKGQCIQCDRHTDLRIHRRDHLQSCVVCHETVCAEHSQECAVCKSTVFCKEHHNSQAACESCGRASCGTNHCSTTSSVCKLCGMAYCRHCMTADGACTTCSHIEPLHDLKQVLPIVEAVPGLPSEELKKTSQTMLKSSNECSFGSSVNRTYTVFMIRHKPSPWLFWRKPKQMRMVVKRDGQIVSARLEKTI